MFSLLDTPKKTLTQLNLSGNRIRDEGAGYLMDALRNNEVTSLSMLSLLQTSPLQHTDTNSDRSLLQWNGHPRGTTSSWCSEKEQCNIFIHPLTLTFIDTDITIYEQTLTELYLMGNRVGDKGAEYLASALQSNEVRSLSNRSFTHMKVYIAKHKQTLRHLSLFGNLIGNKGAQHLTDVLKKNKVKFSSIFSLLHVLMKKPCNTDIGGTKSLF